MSILNMTILEIFNKSSKPEKPNLNYLSKIRSHKRIRLRNQCDSV